MVIHDDDNCTTRKFLMRQFMEDVNTWPQISRPSLFELEFGRPQAFNRRICIRTSLDWKGSISFVLPGF